ncbi:trypsin beta-like [Aphidius gifuensis]|uniref:trypsin beta-like n=1 Tax=Aphidius gifuensis TaxID=684658 RepID=UPI001CDCDCA3|nr:trypsin beta-like [Aphidius gifuensis]
MVSNGNPPDKIYGGDLVEISKYPHQVSVQFRNEHFCGGVIISNYHILTAASCILDGNNVFYANIQVLSGSDKLIPSTYNRNWKIHQVSFVIFHKNYNPRAHWINDIAILKLSSELRFSFACKSIRMPTTHMSTRRHITGWGRDPNTGILNNNLQRLWVRSTPGPSCQRNYGIQTIIYPTQYCLTPKSTDTQVTMGNAGSPVAGGTQTSPVQQHEK